jgi:hypothetical protein
VFDGYNAFQWTAGSHALAAAGDHDGLGLLVAGQPIRDPQCRTGPSRSTRTSSVVGGTAMPPH